ncbi:hypothetical protein WJX79_001357 [Trebouxia sp. C0005]
MFAMSRQFELLTTNAQRLCSQTTPLRWSSSQSPRAAVGKLGSFQVSASQRVDITSAGNDHVKHCHKLRTSSQYRDACGRVLLVGSDLLQEVVLHEGPGGPIHVHSLLVRNRCEPPTGIPADRISVVTDEIMNKMCGLQNSDGVQAVAEVDMPKFANLSDANTTSLQRLLVLERLQDPGNLGTLLRTAVALGWDACFLLPGCCSEGQGLSKTALEHSTPLAIPMTDRMESLNVSQAGAILMFAFCGNSLKLYDQVKRPH